MNRRPASNDVEQDFVLEIWTKPRLACVDGKMTEVHNPQDYGFEPDERHFYEYLDCAIRVRDSLRQVRERVLFTQIWARIA